MTVSVTPAEPAAAPASPAAAHGARTRTRRPEWRALLLGLGSILGLVTVVWLGYELALARLPEHRAALERLVRDETQLDLHFSELGLRWGWYGPEAVFRDVELGVPAEDALQVRAPELVVGLDVWRMLRSGQPEAGRITLVAPEVVLHPDLDTGNTNIPARSAAAHGAQPHVWAAAARVLSRWRGGRIDIEGGTLRWPTPGEPLPLAVGLRHVTLRRLGAQWSADALVQLPESLGASLHLNLQMQGDPAQPTSTSGTLRMQAQRLEAAQWRTALTDPALADPALAAVVPQAGIADIELQMQFAAGRVVASEGKLHAEALEWAPRAAGAAALALPRLRAAWQLARAADTWHLSVSDLELDQSATPASFSLVAAADMQTLSGTVQHAPLAALADVVRWRAPELPFADLDMRGLVRVLTFDWSARRAAGERLRAGAQLDAMSLATAGGDVVLAGLGGRASASDASFSAELRSEDAQLTLVRADALRLAGLKVAAHVIGAANPGGWQLSSDDVQIRQGDANLAAAVSISAHAGELHPGIDASARLVDADVVLLTQLLGPAAANVFGASGARLTAGRITDAQFTLHGRLDEALPWSQNSVFRGALELRDASLAASDWWPEVHGVNAHLDWRGSRFHAALDAGATGTWQLSAANLDWDAQEAGSAHFTGRFNGAAQEALAWMRERAQLFAAAPAIGNLDLAGDTLLDVDITVPGGAAPRARPRARLTAFLDGVRLRPLAGLPPIQELRGTLAFSAGHVARSTLTGQWLGGPVALSVAEHRERGVTGIVVSGRGLMSVREALLAAGGSVDTAPLQGNAEWTASLGISPAPDSQQAHWRIRADSNLVGVSSRLPEPLAKTQGAAVPLRIDAQGDADSGQLRVSVGERLHGVAAVTRSGDTWRIERGTVRLAASVPSLPQQRVLLVEGSIGRLDLPACLTLWRQAGADAALPALQAHLKSDQLLIGTRSYPDVTLTADAERGSGEVQIQSSGLSGSARWPTPGAAVSVHFAALNVAQLTDVALGADLVGALGADVAVSADQLQWQGRPLGRFTARVSLHGDSLELRDLQLIGPNDTISGSAGCQEQGCGLKFTLDSTDAAATLERFGLRPDLSANRAQLTGDLHWPQDSDAALAVLSGRLHMQLQDGVTRAASATAPAAPFALLAVPALVRALGNPVRPAAPPELKFASLSADFVLHDGQAQTADLHCDGDAEILMRGRVGLSARDYDAEVWILRGEDRLPSAVRGFGPTPRMAAAWLSLRELFTGSAAERAGAAALRLQGSWDDPVVVATD
jgi:uncharacterized protein YhdP